MLGRCITTYLHIDYPGSNNDWASVTKSALENRFITAVAAALLTAASRASLAAEEALAAVEAAVEAAGVAGFSGLRTSAIQLLNTRGRS